MNCKPGDLAIVVTRDHAFAELVGRIVRVTRVYSKLGTKFWDFESAPIIFNSSVLGLVRVDGFEDVELKPIRPSETPNQSVEAMRVLHHAPCKVAS